MCGIGLTYYFFPAVFFTATTVCHSYTFLLFAFYKYILYITLYNFSNETIKAQQKFACYPSESQAIKKGCEDTI